MNKFLDAIYWHSDIIFIHSL